MQQFPESSQQGWMTGGDRNRVEHVVRAFKRGDRPSRQHCVGLCPGVLRDFCFSKMIQGSSLQRKIGYTYFQGSVFVHYSNYCSSQRTTFTFCSIRKTTRCEWWGTDFPEQQLSSSWPHILKASCWSQVCTAHWSPLSRLIYLISSRGTHSSEREKIWILPFPAPVAIRNIKQQNQQLWGGWNSTLSRFSCLVILQPYSEQH